MISLMKEKMNKINRLKGEFEREGETERQRE